MSTASRVGSHKVFKYRQGDVKTLSPMIGLVDMDRSCRTLKILRFLQSLLLRPSVECIESGICTAACAKLCSMCQG